MWFIVICIILNLADRVEIINKEKYFKIGDPVNLTCISKVKAQLSWEYQRRGSTEYVPIIPQEACWRTRHISNEPSGFTQSELLCDKLDDTAVGQYKCYDIGGAKNYLFEIRTLTSK